MYSIVMVTTLPSLVSWHRRSVSRLSSLCREKQEKRRFFMVLNYYQDTALSVHLPPQRASQTVPSLAYVLMSF